MASVKHEVIFPKWHPQQYTIKNFKSADFKVRLKSLRNSSSNFIKKKEVRKIIFDLYNNKCYLCDSKEDLQIDHIVSVYRCAKNEFPIQKLNSIENLALICKKCNCGKRV